MLLNNTRLYLASMFWWFKASQRSIFYRINKEKAKNKALARL